MEITEVAQLISHGGVVALALVVWYELRIHRAELKQTREVIAAIGQTLAKILERDRDREIKEFIKEEISGVHDAGEVAELARAAKPGDDDDTPVDMPSRPAPGEYREIKKRPRTNPGGVKIGEFGGPKDRSDRGDRGDRGGSK